MVPSTKGETRATVLYTTYTSMVSRAGGLPVILTPGSADEAEAVVGRLDGLLLSGGGDVDPSRYDGSPVETLYGVDPLRDEYEIALARAARDAGLPTLAICRGMQVLNVALGGSLIEDIPSEDPDALQHRVEGLGTVQPQHPVALEPGSAVATAIGTTQPDVNTVHHQAIRDLGEGLRTVGWAPDGVIEALEPTDDWQMWAVQWHPEYLGPDDEPSIALFRTLVEAAGR
jgi:putative glutamine amidotransferase